MTVKSKNVILELSFEFALTIIEYTEELEKNRKFIIAKEAEETAYWLLLCQKSRNYPSTLHLLDDLKSIQKHLSKIISSAKSAH
ncbi:MAG: hypothetical protein L3J66_04225 [Bacteroidales bacterium]|nr:hypothetical protein [Bacteroidales bacterium]